MYLIFIRQLVVYGIYYRNNVQLFLTCWEYDSHIQPFIYIDGTAITDAVCNKFK